ncbi:hypothetical protein [Nitratiruptor sp. YY09-18]|uniref:hypothetical protein n=1 Tax=Nitratiruptor sp. YY09-18 TaxID=2724901 RepID=UPI0018EAE190|nr:hypothetical protein [Nitratiruptor sp. YY09-18]BCD68945.1 hypothetical protein NitYY0918_P12 [Nitratiruptor sp. YY09-18]
MNKNSMISIIAASLLTATVVFTGCGGGGSSAATSSSSSSSVSSSSSSSVSSSSSSSVPAVKPVVVSDGYVLGADVICGTHIAAATTVPGKYEFNVANCPVTMVSQNGYIDTNGDKSITQGEPVAPTMKAPKDYSNINPLTTFLAEGVSLEDLEAATGLSATQYNNFDIDIPSSNSFELAKQAALLSAAIAYIQNQNANTSSTSSSSSEASSSSSSSTGGVLPAGPRYVRGVLPAGPGTNTSSTSSSSSEASSSSSSSTGGVLPAGPGTSTSSTSSSSSEASGTPLTYISLIERLKNGENIEDIIPGTAVLANVSAADYQNDPHIFDKKLATVLPKKCENEICIAATQSSSSAPDSSSSSTEESSSSVASSQCTQIPGYDNCAPDSSSSSTEESSSSVASSSSSTAQSSSSSQSSNTSTGGVLPAGPGA